MEFNTIKQLTSLFQQELNELYPETEIRNFITIIFEYKMAYSKVDIIMKATDKLPDSMVCYCKETLHKLKLNIPIQYIIGQEEFYGLMFNVNPSVLIPRPETEELIHWIINDNTLSNPTILDIGTGSGCIPITLKHHIKEASISAWDISADALNTAKLNAIKNKTEVNFILQDALAPVDKCKIYDIIVSNPPYICELEKKIMHNNVLDNEPHMALFVKDEDPLLFYRSICAYALEALKSGGKLYFEINEAYGKQTCELMQKKGFKNIKLRNDLFGKARMIRAEK